MKLKALTPWVSAEFCPHIVSEVRKGREYPELSKVYWLTPLFYWLECIDLVKHELLVETVLNPLSGDKVGPADFY